MSQIAERLHSVTERIRTLAIACGREAGDIKLVAVSKTKPAAAIREAYEAGQRVFGENYAQELASKVLELSDLPDLEWHFIGHLQSNKAKLIVKAAELIHTVDSPSLANELARRASALGCGPRSVLLEVNVGGEAQKFGVAPSDLEELIRAVEALPALRLRGLMTVPPDGGGDVARRVFETLGTLRNLHGGAARLPELSMGMTGDLEEAIACGATMVRIGTAIFGER